MFLRMHLFNRTNFRLLSLLLILFSFHSANAEIRLPKVFSSHMVLQREKPIVIWGWAQPNETVTVQLASASQQATANARGEWKVTLPAMPAGGPYTLTVTGSSTVACDDVLIGEVWLCSGQSNMEMGIGQAQNGPEEIAAADYPNIRLLKVPKRWTPEPQTDIDATWKVCTPATISEGGWNGFSAAGFYFGRNLFQKLNVPIGLIDSTWGGTRIESWTPPQGFAAVPALSHENERVELADVQTEAHRHRLDEILNATQDWINSARAAEQDHKQVPPMPGFPDELRPPHDLQNATALFNGMINPLCPFSIRGAIWYQGEANVGEGMRYRDHMQALIGGWRQIWGEGDFPFYFVQIAPYNYGGNEHPEAELWEAQTAAANEIPNSGMVVINDIGNLKDIHPTNKQEVGRRLALWALAKTYGQSDLVYSGPTFKSLSTDGEKLRVAFDHDGAGLKSRDGQPLHWFDIIDADHGGWVRASGQIDADSVILTAPGVEHPVAVRFAWSMLAEPNLMNADGLPAGAFRAGEVPHRDALEMNVPEAANYHLVYDLDLSKIGASISYDVDNHAQITQPFDRIAYFLETQKGEDEPQFVYVSVDAFTQDAGKIGIPTFQSGAFFQQSIRDMNIVSDVPGVTTGTDLPGGNMEFWPNNYGAPNSANVPNASDSAFDFGDQPTAPQDGYGSMQIHNHAARQTVFAVNHWREGSHADIGIGNQGANSPDWTFAANAGSYSHKRLRVFVHYK